MNRLWITFASLTIAPLCAETAGNLNFQFPSSNYEWQLLMDDTHVKEAFEVPAEVSEDMASVDVESSEREVEDKTTFKVFTHREGDALELFYAIDVSKSGREEKVIENLFVLPPEEEAAIPFVEKQMNKLGFFFPNHKIVLLSLEATDDNCLLSWACHDGVVDILHGQLRAFKTKQGFAMLHYMTTAQANEHNLVTWKEVLSRATHPQ